MAFKKVFSTFTELDKTLRDEVASAEEQTIHELHTELQSIIIDNVYTKNEYAMSDDWYSRDWNDKNNFFSMWKISTNGKKEKATYSRNRGNYYQVYSGIEADESVLSRATRTGWEHYSKSKAKSDSESNDKSGGDISAYDLARVINDGVKKDSIFEGGRKPRKYWDEFMDYCDKEYARIFARNFEGDLSRVNIVTSSHANQYTGAGM